MASKLNISLRLFFLKLFGNRFPSAFAGSALKLFMTPLDFKPRDAERELAKLAKSSFVHTKAGDLCVYDWGGEGPMVLLVHGWSGRGTQMGTIAVHLKANGFHPISFDAPAHGRSSGGQASLLAFSEAVTELQTHYGCLLAVGHSLGGSSLILSESRQHRFHQIVTIGSTASVREAMIDFARKMGFESPLLKSMIRHTEHKFGMRLETASAGTLAPMMAARGLIIHDTQDEEVPVHNAEELHKAWKQSQLLLTEGLGHRKILHQPEIHEKIAEFLQS